MIPKTIHYCWFGRKPLNKLAVHCIHSWRKHCPDYEIREWNEDNFDFRDILYAQQAYAAGKYAFVSDFARFDIVYNHGGIYLDVDVELLKSLDPLLNDLAFMGLEKPGLINAGLGFGAVQEHPLIGEIRSEYLQRLFINSAKTQDLTTVVQIVSDILRKKGFKDGNIFQEIANCKIYPTEYFQPLDYTNQKLNRTESTYSIHHYAASWYSPTRKILKAFSHMLGPQVTKIVRDVLRR